MDPRPNSAPAPERRCVFRLPVGQTGYCQIAVPIALACCIGPFARLSAFRRDGGLLDMNVTADGPSAR